MEGYRKSTGLISAWSSGGPEAGCDEAGRGCLAGPVFAAAVILPPGARLPFLNDSKMLSAGRRETLRQEIEQLALAWSVASVPPGTIDEINILKASILAMHRALDGLTIRPVSILVDGNRFYSYRDIPHRCEVKGDSRFAGIAAASILAKTYRDAFMEKLHVQFPAYQWNRNRGYPTPSHREAIARLGITIHHRKSFRLLPDPTLFPA